MFRLEELKSKAALLFLLMVFAVLSGCERNVETAAASYPTNSDVPRCSPDSRMGRAGSINGKSTEGGIKFNVRTPSNYDPTIAHPLLMVYAPAKANRKGTERETGFTLEATAAGLIVAYADHPEFSPTTTMELGSIPSLIAQKWCIDERRVFLTGHSDGGTAAMALAFMAGTKNIPAAIAPSAAGINHESLFDHRCPDPLPVMVMHSANDQHFPHYGMESVAWWAECNGCKGPTTKKLENGCVAYSGCKNGVNTWYCEGSGAHAQWPKQNSSDIIKFFLSSARKKNDRSIGF
ncbi:MAG: alpha/beta hydrolase family esterase [Methylococcales bacterium]